MPGAGVRPTIPAADPGPVALFRRKLRPLPCLLLAIALFVAQVGALLHATSHVDPRQDGTRVHVQLCSQCLSFSSVLSMAGTPSAPFVLPGVSAAVLALAAILSLVDRSAPNAFRSRAPPRLL